MTLHVQVKQAIDILSSWSSCCQNVCCLIDNQDIFMWRLVVSSNAGRPISPPGSLLVNIYTSIDSAAEKCKLRSILVLVSHSRQLTLSAGVKNIGWSSKVQVKCTHMCSMQALVGIIFINNIRTS